MKTDEFLQNICKDLDGLNYINPDEIPNIDLYMDQVTTFMNKHLASFKRYSEDKILTKTMINNYAKNNLLPPPVKKKYSKEHLLMLIFIYYYKGILSINDIQNVLAPLADKYFLAEDGISLEDIYTEIFSLEHQQIDILKKDLIEKHKIASDAFQDEEDNEFLQTFLYICLLSFDVYLKKQIIERLIDNLETEKPPAASKNESKESKKNAP